MKFQELRTGETAGSYIIDTPITEADILRLALQLAGRRMARGKPLTNPLQVAGHLQMLLQGHEHEVFALLLLDSRNRVIRFQEVFRGTLDSACVYPREVAKIALAHNAAAVILVHNHPSGDPEPSQADIALTRRLKDALGLLEIRILDHLVVGYEGCVSLAERGHL